MSPMSGCPGHHGWHPFVLGQNNEAEALELAQHHVEKPCSRTVAGLPSATGIVAAPGRRAVWESSVHEN